MANGMLDQSIITPLSAHKRYAGIGGEERCKSCGTRNAGIDLIQKGSGKNRYHPHKDILSHVVGGESVTGGLRKLLARKTAKGFFPDITDSSDSITSSPKTSASLMRRNRENQIVERIMTRPGSVVEVDSRGRHNHYHIHTHHHYASDGKSPPITKSYSNSITRRRKPVTPYIPSDDGIPYRAAARAKKSSVSRPCTAKQRKQSSTNPPNTAQSLPRISGTPLNRKNSNSSGPKSYRPVTAKRKRSNTKKDTPPSRKITPPKKLSDAPNPVISTNNPTTSKKSRLAKSAKPKAAKTSKQASDRRSKSAYPKSARHSRSKDEQNFVVHSPEPKSENLYDKIIRSRSAKGYPPSAVLESKRRQSLGVEEDDGSSAMLSSYSNFRDRVDIYINPHAPTGVRTYEDIGTPRQKWFPNDGVQSKSTPGSPIMSSVRRREER